MWLRTDYIILINYRAIKQNNYFVSYQSNSNTKELHQEADKGQYTNNHEEFLTARKLLKLGLL